MSLSCSIDFLQAKAKFFVTIEQQKDNCCKSSFPQSGERGRKFEQSPTSSISAKTQMPLMAQSVDRQQGKPVNGSLQRLYWKQAMTTAYRQLRNSASGKQMRNPWRKATGLAHQGMYLLTTKGMMMNSLATWWISSAFWQTVSAPSTIYLTSTSQTQKRQVMARNSLLRWSVKRCTLVEGFLNLLRQAMRKGMMPRRLILTHRLLAMQQCLCQSICIPDYYQDVRPFKYKRRI